MLNAELHHAAEMFVATIQSSDDVRAFRKARILFHNDPTLSGIRQHLNRRSTELQGKQSTGTLTQEEINELRRLQSSLNTHPVTAQYIHARQKMVEILQECNRSLSQELGFDFASAAAPSCCG